jgi:molybdopterin synthase sulfur carrier subunit
MRVLYFAWLREQIGLAEEDIDLPAEVTSVAALIDWLRVRGPGYAAAFAEQKLVRCAVDQEFAAPDTAIAGAAEIAFFPPVTGG